MSRATLPEVLLGMRGLLLVCLAGGAATAEAQTVFEAGKFGNWTLHQSEDAGQKICFAVSEPTEKTPPGANRGKVLLYVSAWTKDGIKTEVSVKQGYPIKPGSEVAVTVGADSFQLFAKDERAFVADQASELKLVEVMKGGATLTVAGTSARGTATLDTYSLTGLTQALEAMAASCP